MVDRIEVGPTERVPPDLRTCMGPILLIGAGRSAFHLGHALRRAGIPLSGVAGRKIEAAAKLAAALGTGPHALNASLPAAGLRILAVSDDAIAEVAASLPADGTPVVHLSGSKPLDLLTPHAQRGVLWPIRSLGQGEPMDLRTVPLVVDADDAGTLALLQALAARLSERVVHLPWQQRQRLHLSAVLASNFPVFLLREAERLLHQYAIDPELIHPLWAAAAEKALHGADQAVTGPARRGDEGTIAQHLRLLENAPELRRAYEALSLLILHTYHPRPRGTEDL
jgi:predicted short-subunit dehydrogenase-like oxidoreductase (DUF2520 family)